jgi:hypothetical protein
MDETPRNFPEWDSLSVLPRLGSTILYSEVLYADSSAWSGAVRRLPDMWSILLCPMCILPTVSGLTKYRSIASM